MTNTNTNPTLTPHEMLLKQLKQWQAQSPGGKITDGKGQPVSFK